MTRIQLNIFYSRVLHSVFFRQFQECDDVQNVTHIHARPHSHTAYSAYTYIYCTYIRYVRGRIAFHNITCWQSRHTEWFQIPYLGSCPPSIDWKISQVGSAKCLASLIWEPVFFEIYTGLLEFGLKLIVFFFSEKYANFIHRQGTTDYKVHG